MRLLFSLLFRIARGERYEKATAEDFRYWFGFFLFSGVLMLGGVCLAHDFLDHAKAVTLWLAATIVLTGGVYGLFFWIRHVPAVVSLALGVLIWGLFVWLALRRTHIL